MSEHIDYLDFEVTIQKAGENEYLVRASSGSGQAEARFANPFNEDKRELIRATLTKVALRSSARVRSSSVAEVRKMREVGSTLFQQAIAGPVREFYYKCQGQADEQGRGIRWRLVVDPSIGDLPWEFMSIQDEFLALNPRSPIVRYIKHASPVAPLKEELPLRLLIVIASPADQIPLDTVAEKARITAALKPLTEQGLIDVSYIEGHDTWEHLIETLRPNQTHILHFIGHGAFDEKNSEGVLVMEDADGRGVAIDSERLKVLVQGKSRLRLVVLNSCLGTQGGGAEPFSSVGAGLVRAGVPAVIAMQFEISDHAAREIAGTFYKSIALNFPVDAAITEARRKIFLSDRDSLEWATPILYMQVPDGRLFQFTGSKGAGARPAGAARAGRGPQAEPRTAPAAGGLDLNAKAAERYQVGEEAMATGDWATALKGYRGALLLVPSYRDSERKLKTCESRQRAANLYGQAQRMLAEQDYEQAAQTFAEARQLDPAFVDTAGVQGQAETGVLYQQALAQLKAGSQERAAELLRGVISRQPDFADAARRLEDLAEGGDGTLGLEAAAAPSQAPAPAPLPAAAAQPPVAQDPTLEPRFYSVGKPDQAVLTEEIRQHFLRNGFENQVLQQGATSVVQGKKTGLRSFVGMGQAATVMIESQGNTLKVSVGGGKWIEQGAAIAVSMLVLWPLLITGGVGMAQQKKLITTLWQIVDNHVAQRGGRRVS